LLGRLVIETQAEHFLVALKAGPVSTNVHLRKLHNFCLDMGWLPWPVLPKRQWPAIEFKEKRAITADEHQAIIAREPNPETRSFYELLWHLGGSQTDVATLTAENVDWTDRVISYTRNKTGVVCQLHLGQQAAALLASLPRLGPLFPRFAAMDEKHRAKEFKRRCDGLGISGISLHSYRYAWAERAKTCGYPERFAQEALGHNSKAVHRAYAKRAKVLLPSLEEFEARQTPVMYPCGEPHGFHAGVKGVMIPGFARTTTRHRSQST
jgi:integrase